MKTRSMIKTEARSTSYSQHNNLKRAYLQFRPTNYKGKLHRKERRKKTRIMKTRWRILTKTRFKTRTDEKLEDRIG